MSTPAAPDELTQQAGPPALGLRGLWRDLANLSAVGLVCLMFYQSQADQRAQLREDRAAARAFEAEAVKALTALHEGQADTTRALATLAIELRRTKVDETKVDP